MPHGVKVSCEAIDSGLVVTLLASLVHLAPQSLLAQEQAHAAIYCSCGSRVWLPNCLCGPVCCCAVFVLYNDKQGHYVIIKRLSFNNSFASVTSSIQMHCLAMENSLPES